MPSNVKDDALGRPNKESVPTFVWTDATFSIIRYECCMIDRLISRQRSALERGQTDLKTIQHMVSVQKMRIERQYLQYLDECIPIQRCAKLVVRLFTARFDAILLHSYSQINVNELQANIREPYVLPPFYRTSGSTHSHDLMLTYGHLGSSSPTSQYVSAPPYLTPIPISHLGLGTPEHTTNTKDTSSSSWKSTATPMVPTPVASTRSSTTSSELLLA